MVKLLLSRAFVLFSILFYVSCSSTSRQDRDPAGQLLNRLRVASYTFDEHEKNRFVLLGVDQKSRLNEFHVNLSELGFEGEDIDFVDPKFLITANRTGVQEVYAFELGYFPKKLNPYHGLRDDNIRRNLQQRDLFPERISALPPKLLDVEKAKSSLVSNAAIKLMLMGVNLTPVFPLSVTLNLVIEDVERARKSNANYLAQLIQSEIEDKKFPQLREAFSLNEDKSDFEFQERTIRQLGSALAIRFHPTSSKKSFATERKDRLEFYRDLLDDGKKYIDENMKELMLAKNKAGFVVVPLGSEHALVFEDSETGLIPKEDYKNYITALEDKTLSAEQRSETVLVSYRPDSLIFREFYSINRVNGPLKIGDAKDPKKYARDDLKRTAWNFVKGQGLAVMNLDFIWLSLKITDEGALLSARFNKATDSMFEYRTQHYGEIQALLQSGIVKLPEPKVILESLLKELGKLDFTPQQIAEYADCIQSDDKEKVQSCAQELISQMTIVQQREGSITSSQSLKEIAETKAIHLSRLKNWIADRKKVLQMNRKLKKKAQRDDAWELKNSKNKIQ